MQLRTGEPLLGANRYLPVILEDSHCLPRSLAIPGGWGGEGWSLPWGRPQVNPSQAGALGSKGGWRSRGAREGWGVRGIRGG